MQKLNQSYINTVVRKALEEDLRPRGDITTNLIVAKDKIIKAKIIAKQDGVVAGLDFCKTAFKLIGKESVFTKKISEPIVWPEVKKKVVKYEPFISLDKNKYKGILINTWNSLTTT